MTRLSRRAPSTTRSRAFSKSIRSICLRPAAHGDERRLVDEVGQVGAGHAGRRRGHHVEVDVGAHPLVAAVHLEDRLALARTRAAARRSAVEAARAQQRRVEDVGPVGGRHDDDALGRLEAVHLGQHLVERLLALVVAAAEAGAALAADRVDLVDEDDRPAHAAGLLEQVADAAGADADEHLHEVRTGDATGTRRRPRRRRRGRTASCRCRAGRRAGCPWARGRRSPGSGRACAGSRRPR